LTANDIKRAFVVLSANYGARFQTPGNAEEMMAVVDIWANALGDIPSDVGLAAFKRHCQTDTQPPTVAHIRNLAAPRALPGAGVAWAAAIDAARTIGYQEGRVPDLGSPEATAAARAVGWSAICYAKDERELSFTRSHFLRIYDDIAKRTEREEHRAAIGGHVPVGLLPQMKQIDKVTP